MAKKNEITHRGKIIEITPDFTTVQIIVSSACSACHAKGLCGMSEDEEKVIMVPTDPYTVYQVGDEVQHMVEHRAQYAADNAHQHTQKSPLDAPGDIFPGML